MVGLCVCVCECVCVCLRVCVCAGMTGPAKEEELAKKSKILSPKKDIQRMEFRRKVCMSVCVCAYVRAWSTARFN